jgi:DNA-binding response OmpR family regulator
VLRGFRGDNMNMTENHKKRILIVEDDQDMNELITAVLSEAGYETHSVYTGEHGIEKAHQIKPDLVLLDIMLPAMDGIEVCRSIASHTETKGIPIIMLTIKKELSVKLASYIAGARRFITKPFGVEELLGEVKKTLRSPVLPNHLESTYIDPRD